MPMPERDDYDVFLESWVPGERLRQASIESNLHDPLASQRLLDDSTGEASAVRTAYVQGIKVIDQREKTVRGYNYFQAHQAEWSTEFRNRLISAEIDDARVDGFIRCFAQHWVDGKSRRQDSAEMMRIKASIRDLDRLRHPDRADCYVLNAIDDSIPATFSPDEMAAIFEINENLLETFMPGYMDQLRDGPTSINHLYIRRGVFMPQIEGVRRELHYLSSYSLAVGPVEQFAQTWTPAKKGAGTPCIFAAPLPAVQKRVVAFAPFRSA
jgi:hypothetical protein